MGVSRGRVLRMAQALAHDSGPRGELFRALLRAVWDVAKELREFTVDDLRGFMHIERILQDLREPRALGLALRWLENRGLIEKIGITVPTKRPKAHGRPVQVFRAKGGGTLHLPYAVKTDIWQKYEKLRRAELGVITLDNFSFNSLLGIRLAGHFPRLDAPDAFQLPSWDSRSEPEPRAWNKQSFNSLLGIPPEAAGDPEAGPPFNSLLGIQPYHGSGA